MKKPIRFIIVSVIVYAVLFIVGGGLVGVPLLSAIVGNNVQASYLYVLYWGMILLVGFIAVCTVVIVEAVKDGRAGEPVEPGEQGSEGEKE